MKPINVGLLGIGTVGGGTWEVLSRNADEIQRRAGRAIRISRGGGQGRCQRQENRRRKSARSSTTRSQVVRGNEIDIVVELIGGYTIAKELVLEAIRHGKHVVTANKALLATHGNEIFAAAQKKGVMVAFEASVAGGVPIIKALREGLAANRIEWIAGIINGTSNFILSEMRDKGIAFDEALKDAQKPRLRRGRSDFRHRGRRRRAQAHHPLGARLRHPDAVQEGLPRGHLEAHQGGHRLRRGARLPHQAAGHHAADGRRASNCACIPRWCPRAA